MAQIFHPSMNTVAKATLFGAAFIVVGIAWATAVVWRSPYVTQVGVPREQPVPFSHEHHVAGLGIDCRYCHTSVEESAFAGLPPTKTCMTCHSKLWTNAQLLEPVRQSWQTGIPIQWRRVHQVPDYVFFNHSIHVNKGVGCATCHGPVDQMPIMWAANTLYMEWCLACHRQPELYLRPRDQVFNMNYQPPDNQVELGRKLIKDYNVRPPEYLENCYICHR